MTLKPKMKSLNFDKPFGHLNINMITEGICKCLRIYQKPAWKSLTCGSFQGLAPRVPSQARSGLEPGPLAYDSQEQEEVPQNQQGLLNLESSLSSNATVCPDIEETPPTVCPDIEETPPSHVFHKSKKRKINETSSPVITFKEVSFKLAGEVSDLRNENKTLEKDKYVIKLKLRAKIVAKKRIEERAVQRTSRLIEKKERVYKHTLKLKTDEIQRHQTRSKVQYYKTQGEKLQENICGLKDIINELQATIHEVELERDTISKDLCLMTDETSKAGNKYMGYEARDTDGKLWVLGLTEICTKSSQDTLNVFKEI
ncbi:hypothetical protein MAR_013782 [Mya arenaria]|uniref:Uncharacterized protein n=1 Tax=Mya arenaria TaxID=6604 RepID=A0ABY7G0V0_MYAAR|nr:hypothetical protein MAR_013782 [Mya arenaria]